MLPALTGKAMREADRFTIEALGIPGFTLMESAGRASALCIERTYGPLAGQRIACICGKGNNGGDGLVIARQLAGFGAEIFIYMMAGVEMLSPDAAANYKIIQELAHRDPKLVIHFQEIEDASSISIDHFDLLIDGLLGTGVTRTLSDRYANVVSWINKSDACVVALDLPTGLHADTGEILGEAVQADLTVTMGALKAGLLTGEGPACAGDIEVVEIGIPDLAIKQAAIQHNCAQVVTRAAVKSWLPERKHNVHKYSVGMSLVVAGAPGLSGAATLAATAAARSGAGAVICATDQSIQHILATKMTEVMSLALPASDEGINSNLALSALQKPLKKAASLLIGCGMGAKSGTQQFIRTLVHHTAIPTVIDADGLNAFIGHTDLFTQRAPGSLILTPHIGEFKRLAGSEVDLSDKISIVRHYAKKWQCVLILKGAPTVVSDESGHVYINPTINPALATAGSGDVLAGLCAGFLAQGLSPVKAALTALFLGGEAADRYTAHHHPSTMLATDIIDQFNQIVKAYV